MNCSIFFWIFALYIIHICNGQEWSDFKRRHVLNPTLQSYRDFTRVGWNNWYKNRTEHYGKHNIINIVIGTDEAVLSLFNDPNINTRWEGQSINHTSTRSHFWSLTPAPLFMMKLNNGTNDYDVYDCSSGSIYYYVAGVDILMRPVEFRGYAENISNDPFITDDTFSKCNEIKVPTSSSSILSFSIHTLTISMILSSLFKIH